MKFSEENNKSIIDEIYESKRDEYEYFIERQNKLNIENKASSEIYDVLDAIRSFCEKDITKETKNIIREYCIRLDKALSIKTDFCQKNFYKLGFIDGMRMAEDIKSQTKLEDEE